jgi:hypothetical protein
MEFGSFKFSGLMAWVLFCCCIAGPVVLFLVEWWRDEHRSQPPER